jgi:hypothetical protein
MTDIASASEVALAILSGCSALFAVVRWLRYRDSSFANFGGAIFASVEMPFVRFAEGTEWLPWFALTLAWCAVVASSFALLAALRNRKSFTPDVALVIATLPGALAVLVRQFGGGRESAEWLLLASVAAGFAAFVWFLLAFVSPRREANANEKA